MSTMDWGRHRSGILDSLAATMLVAGAAVASVTPQAASADELTDEEREIAAAGGAYEFSGYLQDLMETMPEAVVDHRWAEDHGEVWVATDSMTGATELAESLPITVTVKEAPDHAVPVAKRSDIELEAMAEAERAGISVTAATYSPQRDEVTLKGRTSPSEAAALLATTKLAARSAGTAHTPRIRYIHDDEPLPEENHRGGRPYSGCTGGFVARRNGQQGITTAAHCFTKPSSYDGSKAGATWMATNKRDVRFMSVLSGRAEPRFQYSHGKYRTVTSRGVVSPGMTIYKFGRVTGYSKAIIRKHEGCVLYKSGRTWCGLYSTTKKVTENGDSGGPWFVGGKALGFTSGSNAYASYVTPQSEVGYIDGTVSIVVQR